VLEQGPALGEQGEPAFSLEAQASGREFLVTPVPSPIYAAGGGAGDAVVAGELLRPGAVAEAAQDQDCLLAAGQRPAPGRVPRRKRSMISRRVTKRSSSAGTSSVAR
jgi:hypothetical protein